MNKIPCASQNAEAKTLPADICIFGHFGRLSLAAVHSADCRFDSGVRWWVHVSSIVTYSCKNFFLLCWNSCKQCSELLMCCCFWSTVSKCSNHFEHSFLIDKCLCKMVNTLPSDIFNSSAILRNFNLWLAKMSLWSFLVLSGTTVEFGWPEHSTSFVCTTLLKVSISPLTIASNGAESE